MVSAPVASQHDAAHFGVATHGSSVGTSLSEALEAKHAYTHIALAGGFAGLSADMLMHPFDTVKTRQQGDTRRLYRINSFTATSLAIFRHEGFGAFLCGISPAAVGSFAGTSIFFATYEWTKRKLINKSISPSLAYLTAGLIADLNISVIYVPSEVLKTRLQLQGRYNNPHSSSTYNYRSLYAAAQTIIKTEGFPALYYGFRATLYRDLPFSALQFAFYENERKLIKGWVGNKHIGLPFDLLLGATAGGMAGFLTTPLDVVKTRIQTQVNPSRSADSASATNATPLKQETRQVSASAVCSSVRKQGPVTLSTSSVFTALKVIKSTEGIRGLFRGWVPRCAFVSVQSGVMFALYQSILSYWFESCG